MDGVRYLRHDSNARRDPKLMILMAELGNEGYFRYFTLLEVLAEQDGCLLPTRFAAGVCAREWQTDLEDARQTLDLMVELGLVATDQGHYFSEGLLKRSEQVFQKRAQASRGGKATQAKASAQAKAQANAQADAPTEQSRAEHTRAEHINTPPSPPRGEDGIPVLHAELQQFLAVYPPTEVYNENLVFQEYQRARRHWGHPADEILAGAQRYAEFVKTKKLSKRHTKLPQNWLSAQGWLAQYDLSPPEDKTTRSIETLRQEGERLRQKLEQQAAGGERR